MNPPRTDLMSLWLSSQVGIVSDGGLISSWSDLSGNGHDAVQVTDANKPILVPSELNGHGVVRFDGSDDYFSGPNAGKMRAAYIIFRVSSALQGTSELASLYGEYTVGHVAPDPRSHKFQRV